jgi:hypothetical protein
MSTTKLTALACVSSNDYNKNIPSMGIATNYHLIKNLPNAGKNKYLASKPISPLFLVDLARLILIPLF